MIPSSSLMTFFESKSSEPLKIMLVSDNAILPTEDLLARVSREINPDSTRVYKNHDSMSIPSDDEFEFSFSDSMACQVGMTNSFCWNDQSFSDVNVAEAESRWHQEDVRQHKTTSQNVDLPERPAVSRWNGNARSEVPDHEIAPPRRPTGPLVEACDDDGLLLERSNKENMHWKQQKGMCSRPALLNNTQRRSSFTNTALPFIATNKESLSHILEMGLSISESTKSF